MKTVIHKLRWVWQWPGNWAIITLPGGVALIALGQTVPGVIGVIAGTAELGYSAYLQRCRDRGVEQQ